MQSMNFSTDRLLWIPALVVTLLGCYCCCVSAEEDCYRGDADLEYDNPCAGQSGQPARLELCSSGKWLDGRCKEGVCRYCDEGEYQDTFTNCSTCLPCTTAAECPPGQVLVSECTPEENAVCGCPAPPPCPTCESCPTMTPCPSETPCPVQTECPACECPTIASETFVPTTPPLRRDDTTENNAHESGLQVGCDFHPFWILLILVIVMGVLNFILIVCLIHTCRKKIPPKGPEHLRLEPAIECQAPADDHQEEDPLLEDTIVDETLTKLQEELVKKNEENKQLLQSLQELKNMSEKLKKKVKELEGNQSKLQEETQEREAHIQEIKHQLAEKDEKVTKLQEDLNKKDIQLVQSQKENGQKSEELEKKIKVQEENLNKLQEETEKKGAQIEEINSQLAEKDEKVTKLQEDLNKKDKEIQLIQSQEELKRQQSEELEKKFKVQEENQNKLQEETEKKGAQIKEINSQLAEKDEKVTKLQEDLNKKDKEIQLIQSQVELKRQQSEELEKKIKVQEGNQSKLQEETQEREAHIQEIKHQLAEKDKKVANLEEDLNKKDKEIQLLQYQVEEMQKESPNLSPKAGPSPSQSDKGVVPQSGKVNQLKPEPVGRQMEDTFEYLSKNLSRKWKGVGRGLGIPEPKFHALLKESDSTEDAIYNMFIHWKHIRGNDVSYETLINALESAGRKDLADYIRSCKDFQTSSQQPSDTVPVCLGSDYNFPAANAKP